MFSKILENLALLWRMSALRQALGLSLLFLLVLCAAGIATLLLVRWELGARTDRTLIADLDSISQILEERGPEQITGWDRDRFVVFHDEDHGRLNDQDRSIMDKLGLRTKELERKGKSDQLWRILVADVDSGRVAIGRSLSAEDEVQELISTAFIWAGLVSALVTIASGLWIGLRTQRRVSKISNVLDQVASGILSARIAPKPGGDDLDIVAHKIDSTTKALERSLEQLHQMSSNIAHDLRTPVARLRAELETALTASERQDHDVTDALAHALGQADQIIETFNALLRIARIESGARRAAFQILDLAEFANEMAEIFSPVVEDSGRQLVTEIEAGSLINADRELLVQLVANLLQNAMRYTPKTSQITLGVRQRKLFINDTGPGIPIADRERVLEPLYRLEASRSSEGAGLGLALVRAVADLHDAKLTLTDNDQAPSGLMVILAFPVS